MISTTKQERRHEAINQRGTSPRYIEIASKKLVVWLQSVVLAIVDGRASRPTSIHGWRETVSAPMSGLAMPLSAQNVALSLRLIQGAERKQRNMYIIPRRMDGIPRMEAPFVCYRDKSVNEGAHPPPHGVKKEATMTAVPYLLDQCRRGRGLAGRGAAAGFAKSFLMI
jgi:hypothetical protein